MRGTKLILRVSKSFQQEDNWFLQTGKKCLAERYKKSILLDNEPGRQIDLKSLSCPTLIEMPVNFINNEY